MSKAKRLSVTFRSPDLIVTSKSLPVEPDEEGSYWYDEYAFSSVFAEVIDKSGCPQVMAVIARIILYLEEHADDHKSYTDVHKATYELFASAQKLVVAWEVVQEDISKRVNALRKAGEG